MIGVLQLLRRHRLRAGLTIAFLTVLVSGAFAAVRAQNGFLQCRTVEQIEVCGDDIVPDGVSNGGFFVRGVLGGGNKGFIILRERGKADYLRVEPGRGDQASSFHFNPANPVTPYSISGDLYYGIEEKPLLTSKGGPSSGIMAVDPRKALVTLPSPDDLFFDIIGVHPNDLYNFDIVENELLIVEATGRQTPNPRDIRITFDIKKRTVAVVAPVDDIPVEGGPPIARLIPTIVLDEKGNLVDSRFETVEYNLGGLNARLDGIKLNAEGGMLIETATVSRADNPGLPSLDPKQPDAVLTFTGLEFKRGRFSFRSGSVSLPDWRVGDAFALTNQRVSITYTRSSNQAFGPMQMTFLVNSTMRFPQGGVVSDTRGYPVVLEIKAKQVNGQTKAAFTGTLGSTSPPAMRVGPLIITAPAALGITLDESTNFFGLVANDVKLSWAGFGPDSAVASSFRLGVNNRGDLVFTAGGGVDLKFPTLRTNTLTMDLTGGFAVENDILTVKLKGAAKINLPGNSGATPSAEMFIRSGDNVRQTCARSDTKCKLAFEYKLSAFEVKIGGFTIGVSNAGGTPDGGFAVEKATLKVPAGISAVGGSVSNLLIDGKGNVAIKGGSIELPPLQVGGISLVSIKGKFEKDPQGYVFVGAGTFPLAGLEPSAGQRIGVDVTIRTRPDGRFRGFGLGLEYSSNGRGIPIAGTGMELTLIRGAFDTNETISKITVTMRASSALRIGPVPVVTANGVAEATIKPFSIKANADLSLLIFRAARASIGVGKGQGFAGGDGFNASFEVTAGIARGNASLRIGPIRLSNGQKKLNIAATAALSVGIKKDEFFKFLPPVDVNVANAAFSGGYFKVRGGSETVGLLGEVGVRIPFLPALKLSIFMDMNGPKFDINNADRYTLINAAQVRALAAQGADGYSTRMVSPAEVGMVGIAGDTVLLVQETIPVTIEQPGTALFGISYPAGAPRLRLRLPDGSILAEQDVDGVNSGFLRQRSGDGAEEQLAFMLADAQPGDYTVLIDNAPALYENVSYSLNAAPAVEQVSASCGGAAVAGVTVNCGGAPAGGQVEVSWAAADSDSPAATVSVGYAPVAADGTADLGNLAGIAEALPMAGRITWDLSEVPSGSYRVVVSVSDGQHAPVSALADLTVTVEDRRAPAAPVGLQATPEPGELTVGWTPNRERDLGGYEIGFGVVQPGVADSPDRFVYSRDMGPKDESVGAGDVVDGKLWGLNDDEEIFIGIRAYDQSGNVSAWSPLLRAKPWALSPEAWTPAPDGRLPANHGVEVAFAGPLQLALDQALPAELLQLRRSDGSLVAGRLEPITDVGGAAVVGLRFVPAAPLTVGASYTAVLRGGAPGVTAADGRQMPADYRWSFQAVEASGAALYLPQIAR